jgi:hypothetical protein
MSYWKSEPESWLESDFSNNLFENFSRDVNLSKRRDILSYKRDAIVAEPVEWHPDSEPDVFPGSEFRGNEHLLGIAVTGPTLPETLDAIAESESDQNSQRRGERGSFPMSFIQRFLERVLRHNTRRMPRTSFEDLSQDELDAHLQVGRYGEFQLTDAIRPSFDLEIVPREGYRRDVYRDPESGNTMPVLAASVSAEKLFEVFMELLTPLGDEIDVVMESSHESEPGTHADMYREHMDSVIFKSTLFDYEELLLNDGCTGLAALNPNVPMEVQFDEHKLLFVYANDLDPFEDILIACGLKRDDTLRFISEAEHLHSTDDVYREQFQELQFRLGIDNDHE